MRPLRLVVVTPYPLKSGITALYLTGYLDEYRKRGFEIEQEKVYFWEGKLRYSLKWLALARHLFRPHTVLLLSQHTPPASGPMIVPFLALARLFGKRTVVVAHETPDTYAKHLPRGLWPLYHAYEASLVHLAGQFVVHTRMHRDALAAFVKKPIEIVPLPVLKPWLDQQGPSHPPAGQGFSPERRYFAYYGMVSRKKGVDILLAAYQSLPAGCLPELKIMGIAAPGEDAYFEALKASVLPSHRARIHFTGYLEEGDKPELFREIALMVFPYRWISQSAVLAETCMFRIPYLASDLAYFKDFQATFGGGRLFRSEDAADLARAMEEEAKHPARVPEAVYVEMERRLSFEACADRMEKFIRG